MANFVELEPDRKHLIASKLSDILPLTDFETLGGTSSLELAESTDIWILDADKISVATSLVSVVRPLCRQYHQIENGGTPIAYAVSFTENGNDEIAEVGDKKFAELFHDALVRIDEQNIHGMVHLLLVPAYQVHALWIDQPTHEVIVLSGSPFENNLGKSLPEFDFLEQLRGLEKIEGFI